MLGYLVAISLTIYSDQLDAMKNLMGYAKMVRPLSPEHLVRYPLLRNTECQISANQLQKKILKYSFFHYTSFYGRNLQKIPALL